MDEKKLEQEYKKLKQQDAPDLWSRIEMNLAEHPERDEKAEQAAQTVQAAQTADVSETEAGMQEKKIHRIPRWKSAYGVAAAAVVIVVSMAANRQFGSKSMAPESAETMAGAPAMAEAPVMDASPVMEGAAEIEEAAPEDTEPRFMSGSTNVNADVIYYDNLQLATYQPLAVPEQAVTVPEDTEYFSEAILGDTGLLCGGTVKEAELEYDESGRAAKVVYRISLDKVYYSEDYTAGMDMLTVKSPIVETEGDEAYVLYQLQEGGTYLLPLEKQGEGWELLYPFAPQIQVTGDGAYLFHSGYSSLVSSDTAVVVGSQEGANDYYYDRMLLRQDDNFLSDFISLVEREAQGRK